MTMRVIDADALLAEYDRAHVGEPGRARKLIEDAPTIDAELVVRCKDCKFFCPYEGEEHKGDCAELVGLESCVYEDDYCSYGEKRVEKSKGDKTEGE
jgi:Pyruvate/2-oxoacid:ferredoxin oxidoreductase delta subunit